MDNISNRMDSFDRFQNLRRQALERQNGPQDVRSKLSDVIGLKKKESDSFSSQNVEPTQNKVQMPNVNLLKKTLQTANEMLLYDRNVNTSSELPGTKSLGNYVDMVG